MNITTCYTTFIQGNIFVWRTVTQHAPENWTRTREDI